MINKNITKKQTKIIQYDYDMVECLRQHIINIIDSEGFLYSKNSIIYSFNIFKTHCELFYKNLCSVLEININILDKFDLNFETSVFEFSLNKENEKFDAFKFAIGTLGLKDEHREQLEKILNEYN